MKIVVFGAGSIGCFVGLTWLASGLDVRFVGRERMADTLRARGATISGAGPDVHVPAEKINYATNPSALAEADLIVLTVKINDDEEACATIRANARPQSLLLSLQNGVNNRQRLNALLPEMSIVEGMVPFNVVQPAPGRFRKASAGQLSALREARLERLFAPLSQTPSGIDFHDDMQPLKWSKLLLNLNNALNALSGLTLHEELSSRAWRRLLATLQRECLEVTAAAEIEPAKLAPLPPRLLPAFLSLPDWIFNPIGLRLQKIGRDARSSMADDFAMGRRTEIDFLNGAVVAAGRVHGVPCPANEAVADLVRAAERGVRRQWQAEEIVAEINRRSADVAS